MGCAGHVVRSERRSAIDDVDATSSMASPSHIAATKTSSCVICAEFAKNRSCDANESLECASQ